MRTFRRFLVCMLCFFIAMPIFSAPALASGIDGGYTLTDLMFDSVKDWIAGFSGNNTGVWNVIDPLSGMLTGVHRPAASSQPQKYYTTPTSSVQDKNGNVTNYYRGGDTTTTNIIDSYNKTFNTIHNTTNNTTTNNYKANVKLENFLNQYTTNNNNYTYSADFKSWYYDNTTNNYNYNQFTKNDYTQNNLYYNQDNSRYYISIDNSTDEYYLIDVQYSPTFVTVNYTYNTTNINNEKVGDVTNVYYYELKDGRNSSSLTAAEVAGMDFGYDVRNYELVTDDPNTLSLQHFDGDYTDSSSHNRSFYSQNRSTNYVDSGAFGKALSLPNNAAAGVQIPNLSGYDSLSFDFRVYFNDIKSLNVYLGDSNILQAIPNYRSWSGSEIYSDHQKTAFYTEKGLNSSLSLREYTDLAPSSGYSTTVSSTSNIPVSSDSSGYVDNFSSPFKVGVLSGFSSPVLHSRTRSRSVTVYYIEPYDSPLGPDYDLCYSHYRIKNTASVEYRSTPEYSLTADFAYDSYRNQWISMRITLSGGKLYYFVNGDLVGSGPFTRPTADKFYIKSSGTVYLDELRVTTGSLSSTSAYTPPSAPYDTNKVLALPDELKANTIYVQHTTPVASHRIGGVRPSNPETGFFYIPLHEDYTGGQPQLYDGSNWVNVTAMVYDGKTLKDAKGFKFSPVGSSPDVDIDAKPERPVKPGDDADPDSCTHDWAEDVEALVSPTCTLAGSKTFVCSKCEKTKKESIPLLDHDWKVKATFPNQYDEEGNQLSIGFTIFECLRCQEQYKSVDGTAPPALNPGGSSTTTPGGDDEPEEEGFLGWLMRKIGEVLGAIGGGILDLLQAALGKIFDGLINLVTMAFDKLSQLVNLFGSFGDALGVLWTWLPSEIMLVLVAGVTVFVFIGLLKLFMK